MSKDLGVDDLMPFGKYKGRQIEDLLIDDIEYLVWVVESGNEIFDEEVMDKISRV